MPGFLITPRQFFFGLDNKLKSDFIGWQLVCNDAVDGTIVCGEIKGSVTINPATETFFAELAWKAERSPAKDWEKQETLVVMIPLIDHNGASHEDGGCHFDPGVITTTRFRLSPPGSMEHGEEADEWARAKRVALQ